MRRTTGWLVVAVMATTTGLAVGTTAQANADCVAGPNGYRVDSAEGGSCTLEAAIATANSNSGSTVTVPAGRYVLDGELDIEQPMTIIGAARPGEAEATVIDGASASRVFDVHSDAAITGVTITGGDTNQTGAGIRVRSGATLVLTQSMVVDNNARQGGGVDVAGTAIIDSSTFVGNTASRKGGAVRADGFLTVVNSTFTMNSAQSGGAVSVAGAADISFSTLVDNTSNNSQGGGLDRNGGAVTVTNSILTDASQSGSDGRDCSGTPDLIGANIVGNAQGCNPGPDVIVSQALLGPLTDNGGPTETIALLDGSIGVDAALTCEAIGGVAVTEDQRGNERPAGPDVPPKCDLGAFEITPLEVELTLSAQSLEDDPADETVQVGVGATSLSSDLLPGAINQTAGLFEEGTIQANPLSTFPLATFPLATFPLATFPLATFPLATFPLSTFPLSTFPLATFPLSTFPLSTFPLATFRSTRSCSPTWCCPRPISSVNSAPPGPSPTGTPCSRAAPWRAPHSRRSRSATCTERSRRQQSSRTTI